MSEQDASTSTDTGKTAGAMLREARVAQNLHIAVMAASIKVAQRKLELLEADRYDELPDATFTRALAQTMCRVLKIDAEPVLARLPSAKTRGLDHVSAGLNAPFRDRPGRREPRDWSLFASPAIWGTALVIIAAAAVVLMPQKWLAHESAEGTAGVTPATPAITTAERNVAAVAEVPAPVASAIPVPAPSPAPAPSEAVAAAPPPVQAPSASAAAVAATDRPVTGVLQLRTSAASWIQVVDANGRVLLARTLEPGETLGLDGATPLRVRVGNAAGTQLSYRGQPVTLAAARDNTANVELK